MVNNAHVGERHDNQREDYFGWGYAAKRSRGRGNGLKLLCGFHGHGGWCWLGVRQFRFQLRIRRFGKNKPAEPALACFGSNVFRTVRASLEGWRNWRAAAC